MKRLFIAAVCCAAMASCTEAGEGSNSATDSSAVQEKTMDATSNVDTSSKDTSSYERMPTKPPDSVKK